MTHLAQRLAAHWYRDRLTPLSAALLPLAALFGAAAALRRGLYRAGVLRATRVGVPVIVVGNIGVGGTGKTPLVRALAAALREAGRRPGIVSRGHAGRVRGVREVRSGDDPALVGDEPVLLAGDGVPVVVGRDRVGAARALRARHPEVDVIIADDGLQHYALGRDVELCLVDATRGFGNGRLLPAGPLREPVRRAARADALVWTVAGEAASAADASRTAAAPAGVPRFVVTLGPRPWRPLCEGVLVPPLAGLPPGAVHAVAGIGNPERFFALVRALGIDATAHAFADHHRFAPGDLAWPGARAILMTEKDAVKCRSFADARMFFLPLVATIPPALLRLVEERLHGRQAA